MAAPATRVIVADDDESLRVWLRHLITITDDIELVGEATDAAAAVELAHSLQPDIAILDVRMPKGGGPEAAQLIGMFARATRVLAFSAHATAPEITAMIEAGASGYLVKGGDPTEVLTAVRTITGNAGEGLANATGHRCSATQRGCTGRTMRELGDYRAPRFALAVPVLRLWRGWLLQHGCLSVGGLVRFARCGGAVLNS